MCALTWLCAVLLVTLIFLSVRLCCFVLLSSLCEALRALPAAVLLCCCECDSTEKTQADFAGLSGSVWVPSPAIPGCLSCVTCVPGFRGLSPVHEVYVPDLHGLSFPEVRGILVWL